MFFTSRKDALRLRASFNIIEPFRMALTSTRGQRKVFLLNRRRNFTPATMPAESNEMRIYFPYWNDLGSCPGNEHFICTQQFAGADRTYLDWNPEPARNLNSSIARDSEQDR